MVRRLLLGVLFAVLLLAGVVIVKTLTFTSLQLPPQPVAELPLDADGAVQRLAKSLTFKTISHQIPWEFRGTAFTEFHDYLKASFPKVHETMQREVVSDYSLLYTWPGSDPAAQPVIFLAHMDVVPVDAGSAELWTHDPFGGTVAADRVWGRGALDDKCSVMALLETAESLIAGGWTPKRTLYFCFGHDEELGGVKGAKVMASMLKERGVKAWFCLDEGSAIVEGVLPGISTPVGLISTAEKGYVSLKLTAEGKGGHSSQPPEQTSLGILCAAIARLEANPFPYRLAPPMHEMFNHAGREMSFPLKMVMANLWLFRPLLNTQLASGDTTRAALHTTTAATIMNAGTKENVLPIKAEAVVNFRILAGDTVESVVDFVRKTLDDDRVAISLLSEEDVTEASPVADPSSDSYRVIAQSFRNVFPKYPAAPGMTLGATDSKHYVEVAENCYRFQPVIFTKADLETVHGTNESIPTAVYLDAIRVYAEIMRNAAS
jgi:carboxypeptidase PM20D1